MKYKDIIREMTLEEKASLMSGKDFWQSQNIDRLGIPSMFLSDGPHGIRKQAAAADHLGLNASIPATCFPTAATVANSWNVELVEKMGKYLGKEAVAQKVNVLLGPGINMKRNPLCGRNFEYYSEDPYLAGKMAAGLIRGIQLNGISACVKHFAVNNQEERRMVIDTIVDERTLREIYLTAFEIAVKEGKTKTVMSSYNMLNGTHTNENIHLMKEILRDEWGFDGVVVTDWGGSNDRVAGLRAGNELEMPTTDGETDKEIVEAIKSGKIQEEVLDECVDRLLDLIFTTEKVF
jgi:beta-glucosidase